MPPQLSTRSVTRDDLAAIAALHARCFGPGRFTRSAYRVREGTPAISRFCRAAFLDQRLVAALRFTNVEIGGVGGAVLLGPLAVDPDFAGKGFGRRLVEEGIADARKAGLKLVVLVGDMPYYGRFGFAPVPPGQIVFPGPVDPARILALEFEAGALAGFTGRVAAEK